MTKAVEQECEEMGRTMMQCGWTFMSAYAAISHYVGEFEKTGKSGNAFNEAQRFAVYRTDVERLTDIEKSAAASRDRIQVGLWTAYRAELERRGAFLSEQTNSAAWELSKNGLPVDEAVALLLKIR